jgi:hypothetical protein
MKTTAATTQTVLLLVASAASAATTLESGQCDEAFCLCTVPKSVLEARQQQQQQLDDFDYIIFCPDWMKTTADGGLYDGIGEDRTEASGIYHLFSIYQCHV